MIYVLPGVSSYLIYNFSFDAHLTFTSKTSFKEASMKRSAFWIIIVIKGESRVGLLM